jgi:hypothetical protein
VISIWKHRVKERAKKYRGGARNSNWSTICMDPMGYHCSVLNIVVIRLPIFLLQERKAWGQSYWKMFTIAVLLYSELG